MAQGNVEFIKKATIKKHKTDVSRVLTDDENVEFSQKILNASIDTGDVITDTEMPTSMLNASLLWEPGVVGGGTPNDLIVEIYKNERIRIIQALDAENVFPINYTDQFKFRVVTSGVDEDFTIPTDISYVADYTIDWGDDSISDITSYDDVGLTHTFATAGTYDIEVRGKCELLKLNGNTQVTELLEMTTADSLSQVSFEGSANLTTIDSTWNVMNLPVNLDSFFYNCSSLSIIPESLDTSNVIAMSNMFYGATNFNQSLSWDLSKVVTVSNMFYGATNFNSAVNFINMGASNKSMYRMFFYASSFNDPSVTNWDTSSVISMYQIFTEAIAFNQPLNWDLSSTNTIYAMFSGATSFNSAVNFTNMTVRLETIERVFSAANIFNDPSVLNWNTLNITNMKGAFYGATAFDQNLGNWNIANVTNMLQMFDLSGISTTSYSNTLIGWAAQIGTTGVKPNITLGAVGCTYDSSASAAITALEAEGWTVGGTLV
jgi:surface protein